MNLHWQIIIAPSPLFILGFTFGVSRSVCLDKCIMTCLHYSIIQNIFTDLKILHRTPVHLSPRLRQPRIFYCLFSFAFFYNVIVWNIQCVAFSDWLLSLSNMHLSFCYVVLWFDRSFFFSTEWYSIVWMYYSLFIHSSTEGHLGCSPVLATMIKLLSTLLCMCSCGCIFSVKYQGTQLLDHYGTCLVV